MSAIDTAMLAAMRSAIAELLPDTAYIVALTNSPDGEGGVTQARGTTGTVACRLDMKQGREQVTGGAIQPYISYMMSMPYDTTVASANLVVHSGVDYAVKSINLGQSWSAVLRVELERIP
jgi:hypothetical protein